MKPLQTYQVYEHMKKFGSITGAEAWEFYRIYRLSAVIFKLRKMFDIKTIMHHEVDGEGNRYSYGEYYLVKGENA